MFALFPSLFLINHDVSDAVSASFFRQGGPKLLDPSNLSRLITQRHVIELQWHILSLCVIRVVQMNL